MLQYLYNNTAKRLSEPLFRMVLLLSDISIFLNHLRLVLGPTTLAGIGCGHLWLSTKLGDDYGEPEIQIVIQKAKKKLEKNSKKILCRAQKKKWIGRHFSS